MKKESEDGTLPASARVAARTRALYRQATATAAGFAADTGLGATDVNALRALDAAAAGPLTPSRLGAELGLSSGAVTKLVDRLEAAGMVARMRDTSDRRQVFVTLTAAARRLGAERLAPIGARIDAAVARLSAEELTVVDGFLAQILEEE